MTAVPTSEILAVLRLADKVMLIADPCDYPSCPAPHCIAHRRIRALLAALEPATTREKQ